MQTATVDKALYFSIWVGLILLLLMPFVVTTQTIFPFIVGKAIYSRTIIEIIFGIWVILAFRNPAFRLPRSWVLLIFGVHLIATFMAGLFGVSFQRSLWSTYERMQGVVDLAHWFALTVILASTLKTSISWRYLLNLNLGVSLVMALLGIAQFNDVQGIPYFQYLKATERIDISLGNAAFVGTFMMVNIIIALGFLVQSFIQEPDDRNKKVEVSARRRRRDQRQASPPIPTIQVWRAFWIITALLNFWVMTLTGTRGALGGLLIGMAFLAVGYMLFGRLKPLRLVAFGLSSLIVLAVIFLVLVRTSPALEGVASSNILLNRIASTSQDSTFRARVFVWGAALKSIGDKPVWGWGPENFAVAFGRYIGETDGTIKTHDQAHNKPIEELTTKGIVGFASYIALWALTFWIILRGTRRDNARDQLLTLFVGAAMAGYFAQNLLLFDTPATLLLYVQLLAFVIYTEFKASEMAATDSKKEDAKSRLGITIDDMVKTIKGRLEVEEVTKLINQSPILKAQILPGLGIAIVALSVVLGIYFFNIRAFNAASTILYVSGESNSFSDTIGYFEESIDTFEPLANYPRLILFQNIANNWDRLSDSQAASILPLIEEEAQKAIESEPENWRIYVELAKLYNKAATGNPEYGEQAEEFLNIANELAPGRKEVEALLAERQMPTSLN